MDQQCPNCGAGLPPGERPAECPVCGTDLQPDFGEGIPFDEPGRQGFFPSLWQTWREATLSPNAFYPRIPTSAAVMWPFLYAILFWWLQTIANALIQQPLLRASMATMPTQIRNRMEALQTSPEAILAELLIGPFLIVAGILLASALFHGILYLLNAARPEFVVTVRTVCYTTGAYVAYVIPAVGPLIHVVWALSLLVIGLARAHATEGWRSAFAVLLPAVVCCGTLFVLALFAAAFLMRAVNPVQ